MIKQTAIDWLIDNLPQRFKNAMLISSKDIIEQAKSMEKDQKEHAYLSGSADNMNDEGDFKKYYNVTYKGGEQ